jgi:adhesin/invasin
VTPGQINAQLPYEVAAGTAGAVVVTPAGRSAPVQFNVAAAAIGMFTYAGSDRAIAANQDNLLNAPATPEARGRAIVLYVTGLGAVSPAVGTGKLAPLDTLSSAEAAVHATVGGASATVLFGGLTPGFIGLGQVNVLIPDGAPTGDAVPVVLESGGQSSKPATVSIRP